MIGLINMKHFEC